MDALRFTFWGVVLLFAIGIALIVIGALIK